MTKLTVHDLDDDVREGLKDLAERHGRTVEDEAREILRAAVVGKRNGSGSGTGNTGSRIAARFSAAGGLEQDIPELRGNTAVPPDLTR